MRCKTCRTSSEYAAVSTPRISCGAVPKRSDAHAAHSPPALRSPAHAHACPLYACLSAGCSSSWN